MHRMYAANMNNYYRACIQDTLSSCALGRVRASKGILHTIIERA